MSEQGWQEFLAADGVDDWVVLHGGATAVFRVPSLRAAAQLAEAVAQVPGLEGSGHLLTMADDRLTVRLSRGVFRLEGCHVELARAVSAVARSHGAVTDRTGAQEVQLAIAAKPDALDVGFWRAVLGYAPLDDDNAIDPLGHGSTVWMQELDAEKPLRHAMHVDVPSLASMPRCVLRRPLPQEATLSTTPTPLRGGSSPTAPATGCASPPGPTDPSRPLPLTERSESGRSGRFARLWLDMCMPHTYGAFCPHEEES
ncbi:MAG TPA: hypothetical protein VF423_04300 [Actinomycetes bacterium]